VADGRQRSVFGRRSEPHTVIIARGEDIRHFTVRPWVAALMGSALAAMAIGYLLATTYLVLRDDLVGAAAAHQARVQQAYEDRISMLRAQVDRITSRQLLDQKLMETKLSELLERQSQLTQRHGRLGPIIDRLSGEVQEMPEALPVPPERPDRRARLRPGPVQPLSAASTSGKQARLDPQGFWAVRSGGIDLPSTLGESDRLFGAINEALREIETEQYQGLNALASNAWQTAERIALALADAGISVDTSFGEGAMGGPLIPIGDSDLFDERVRELDAALEALEAVKGLARAVPISNPSPGHPVTSGFGPRRDPFLGTMAYHSGIDFRAPPGAPIRSAGAGTVISAGWNGGYGRMVEVDHGEGLTTRYAHMSRISVKTGDRVERGDVLGKVGSTGRSTGPHLHFEVRREGDAIDPRPFLRAGRKVAELL
jgi:murein DD-endopeptidase MepM/ murein hydrolase activator NlpD